VPVNRCSSVGVGKHQASPPPSSRQLLCPSQGFVYYVLRYVLHSLQPCSVHLLPIYLLAGCPHFGCVQLANANCPVRPSLPKASLSFTCIVRPPPYPDGKYTAAASYGAGIAIRSSWLFCQPLVGARRHVRSFLPPVPYAARLQGFSPDKFAGQANASF
jgi:hypothetical protein